MMRIVFQTSLCVAMAFSSLGCKMSQTQSRERFLISHGFHRNEHDVFSRHYSSLSAASRDLGFPIDSLRIPPNGPGMDAEDTRIADLRGWGFVVTADKGRTLDDLATPCIVGTALVQVPPDMEMPKGFR